jgi:hypothetical protein
MDCCGTKSANWLLLLLPSMIARSINRPDAPNRSPRHWLSFWSVLRPGRAFTRWALASSRSSPDNVRPAEDTGAITF